MALSRKLIPLVAMSFVASCSNEAIGPNPCSDGAGFGDVFTTCDSVASTVSARCDGGLPDGSLWLEWESSSSQVACLTALAGACVQKWGPDQEFCAYPIQGMLIAIDDAGTCAEADAIRCPAH